jgi:adsorption protein B
MKENFVKDRKIFLAAASSLLGYALLIYFILLGFGQLGIVPFKLLPIIEEGSVLHRLVVVDTGFMIFRMLERVVFVGMTYGLLAGLLSIPRLLIANVINGIAAFRALQTFARARQGKAAVRWDNTDHLEGVGQLPTAAMQQPVRHAANVLPPDEVLRRLRSGTDEELARMMESLPRDLSPEFRHEAVEALNARVGHEGMTVRSALARVIGFLAWPELVPALFALLHDREWVVRANSARALLKFKDFDILLEQAFVSNDPLLREILIRCIEQDSIKQRIIMPRLSQPHLIATRSALLTESAILRAAFETETGRPYMAPRSAEDEARATITA